MTVKLSSLKSDSALQNEGEWVDVPEWPGVSLKVRSLQCRDFRLARDLLQQKLMRKLGRIPTSAEIDEQSPKLYAKHLLRGWKGFDVEYSEDAAAEILQDPEHQPLREQIFWAASRVGDTDIEFMKEAEKNSDAPSATT